MLSQRQRSPKLLEEIKAGFELHKIPPPFERQERFSNPHSPILRSLQALDTIEFESEFKQGKIDLITFKVSDNPQIIQQAIDDVPAHEKRHIKAIYYLSSIGTGLSCTIGIMMKFSAPIVVGGAGIVIAMPILIGLTAGCGIIALALAYYVRKIWVTKEIRNSGLLLKEIEHNDEKIIEQGLKIERELKQSFTMLLRMQLALENLKRTREQVSSISTPSLGEEQLKKRIDDYIDFLVTNPHHPNFSSIESPKRRLAAMDRATERQVTIRHRLQEACELIQSGQTTLKNYIKKNPAEIRACFPSLHLIAPKIKLSISDIVLKPEFGLSFLGGFTGTFGLSYSMLGIISAFFVLPMLFPPLYVILPIAFIGACYIAHSMYKIKKVEEERKTFSKNQQKYIAYLHRADNLLSNRYTKELEHYTDDQSDTVTRTTTRSPSRTPPLSNPVMDSKSEIDISKSGLSFLETIGQTRSSTPDQPSLIQTEDLRFNDPSQLTEISSQISCLPA